MQAQKINPNQRVFKEISAYSYPEIRGLALLAEKYGFDSVHVKDHLVGPLHERPFLKLWFL